MKSCSLCKLESVTREHWQTGHWKIVTCWTCKIPMVVWKPHSMEVPAAELAYILEIVGDLFGRNVALRMNQRQISDHFHFHILTTTHKEERGNG